MMQWKTREGKLLYPKDMTDKHLLATIKHLEKKIDRDIDRLIQEAYNYGEPDPDTAAYDFFEFGIRYLENETSKNLLIDNVPIYRDLVREARRRKLLPFDYLGEKQ